jgi:hypothetical protein
MFLPSHSTGVIAENSKNLSVISINFLDRGYLFYKFRDDNHSVGV